MQKQQTILLPKQVPHPHKTLKVHCTYLMAQVMKSDKRACGNANWFR